MGIHKFPSWRLACSARKKPASSLVFFLEALFAISFFDRQLITLR